jgi:dihydrodipicolinate synthase/N-acetylneuraminate lyase
MLDLSDPVVALLTPFDRRGKIDWQAFKSYLSALSGWGVRSAVCNGTTAEFSSLTLNERQKILEFVKNNFAGTLIDNVSSTCVKDSRKLIRGAQGIADAVLLLPPYYYAGARTEGLCRFFTETLADTTLPVFLYNFPKHTGNPIDGRLIKKLLEHGIELTGIKDSSGRIENAVAYKAQFPQLNIFYADDSEALKALQAGLSGSVTGGANPLPECLLAIRKHFDAADGKAQALQRVFNVWNDYRSASGFPEIPLVKAAMGARLSDFPVHARAPFTALPAEAVASVRAKVIECLSELHAVLANRP